MSKKKPKKRSQKNESSFSAEDCKLRDALKYWNGEFIFDFYHIRSFYIDKGKAHSRGFYKKFYDSIMRISSFNSVQDASSLSGLNFSVFNDLSKLPEPAKNIIKNLNAKNNTNPPLFKFRLNDEMRVYGYIEERCLCIIHISLEHD